MHINLNINTAEISETDKRILAAIAHCIYAPDDIEQPQPEVGENTGTSSTGLTLSPGVAGVGEGAGAPASAGQQTTPSAPEKRTRKPKETAAAPVGESQAAGTAGGSAPNPAPTTEQTISTDRTDPAPKLTIDDVRAKLQAFTGAKGIDAGLALLGEFKAGRISDLKAEDYPAFVGKCEVA